MTCTTPRSRASLDRTPSPAAPPAVPEHNAAEPGTTGLAAGEVFSTQERNLVIAALRLREMTQKRPASNPIDDLCVALNMGTGFTSLDSDDMAHISESLALWQTQGAELATQEILDIASDGKDLLDVAAFDHLIAKIARLRSAGSAEDETGTRLASVLRDWSNPKPEPASPAGHPTITVTLQLWDTRDNLIDGDSLTVDVGHLLAATTAEEIVDLYNDPQESGDLIRDLLITNRDVHHPGPFHIHTPDAEAMVEHINSMLGTDGIEGIDDLTDEVLETVRKNHPLALREATRRRDAASVMAARKTIAEALETGGHGSAERILEPLLAIARSS